MSAEHTAIVTTLRKVLKNRKLTYAQLAARLDVSEQTIKRVFNGDDCTLSRVTDICKALGIRLVDVIKLADDEPEPFFHLSVEQEEHFVENPHDYTFFRELLEGNDAESIKTKHGIRDDDVYKYLRRIEKLGLCDALPGNKYKLKVHGDHTMRRNGPMAKKHGIDLMTEMFSFLSEEKNQSDRTYWTSSSTFVSAETLRALKQDMDEIARRYRKLAYRDGELLPKDQLVETTWVLALATPFLGMSQTKIPRA